MNLSVVRGMLDSLGQQKLPQVRARPDARRRHYQTLVEEMAGQFTRFEIIGYHQWTVLHHSFTFEDTTHLTGVSARSCAREGQPTEPRAGAGLID